MSLNRLPLSLLLLSALALPGCALTIFNPQNQATDAAVKQRCPSECQVEAPKAEPKLREYVERQQASVGLQLGAFKAPTGASALVKRLRRSYPVVFDGRVPIIRAIERDGSTLYRVILGPFSDPQAAEAFCNLLRQNSEGCFLTTFDRIELRVDRVTES